jgi:hypothetical protein
LILVGSQTRQWQQFIGKRQAQHVLDEQDKLFGGPIDSYTSEPQCSDSGRIFDFSISCVVSSGHIYKGKGDRLLGTNPIPDNTYLSYANRLRQDGWSEGAGVSHVPQTSLPIDFVSGRSFGKGKQHMQVWYGYAREQITDKARNIDIAKGAYVYAVEAAFNYSSFSMSYARWRPALKKNAKYRNITGISTCGRGGIGRRATLRW